MARLKYCLHEKSSFANPKRELMEEAYQRLPTCYSDLSSIAVDDSKPSYDSPILRSIDADRWEKEERVISSVDDRPLKPSICARDESEVGVQLDIELVNGDLWSEFHQNQNEMIITKKGRCLFPILQFAIKAALKAPLTNKLNKPCPMKLSGLEEMEDGLEDHEWEYSFALCIRKSSNIRYRWKEYRWEATHYCTTACSNDKATDDAQDDEYLHPDGFQTLEYWTKGKALSFSKARLTNCCRSQSDIEPRHGSSQGPTAPMPDNEHLFHVESFFKYLPILKIYCRHVNLKDTTRNERLDNQSDAPVSPLLTHSNSVSISMQQHCVKALQVKELAFAQTEFIAVTHYQNPKINNLKKNHNPHAKGFIEKVVRVRLQLPDAKILAGQETWPDNNGACSLKANGSKVAAPLDNGAQWTGQRISQWWISMKPSFPYKRRYLKDRSLDDRVFNAPPIANAQKHVVALHDGGDNRYTKLACSTKRLKLDALSLQNLQEFPDLTPRQQSLTEHPKVCSCATCCPLDAPSIQANPKTTNYVAYADPSSSFSSSSSASSSGRSSMFADELHVLDLLEHWWLQRKHLGSVSPSR